MLLDDDNYPRKDIINFTNDTFLKYFGENIQLLKFDYSNGGMGFYAMEYLVLQNHYKIRFEHDRLFIAVYVKNENGVEKEFSELDKVDSLQYPTGKNIICEENIEAAIKYVYKKLIIDKITF